MISEPDPEDVCCILADTIVDAKLEWLDDSLDFFTAVNTSAKKATLPCGHSFYALALLYHFSKNNMRCPVCRGGEDNTLNSQCIPKHLRHAMTARVTDTTKREAEESEQDEHEQTMAEVQRVVQENMLDILEIVRASSQSSTNSLNMVTHPFTLTIFMYCENQNTPASHLVFPLYPSPTEDLAFHISGTHLRNAVRYFRSLRAGSIAFTVSYNGVIYCHSARINLPFYIAGAGVNTPADVWSNITPHARVTPMLFEQAGVTRERARLILACSPIMETQDPFFPIEAI
eukprot:2785008-Rhodomonas_salina.1